MPVKRHFAVLICAAVSLAAALLFLFATYASGKPYSAVARIGGATWVFLLSLIITMPPVISRVSGRQGPPPPS